MEIRRQKEVVEAFHYDMKMPDQEVETDLKVGFSPLKKRSRIIRKNIAS